MMNLSSVQGNSCTANSPVNQGARVALEVLKVTTVALAAIAAAVLLVKLAPVLLVGVILASPLIVASAAIIGLIALVGCAARRAPVFVPNPPVVIVPRHRPHCGGPIFIPPAPPRPGFGHPGHPPMHPRFGAPRGHHVPGHW